MNAHLQADGFEAMCSVLSRVDGKSTLGRHSYERTICVGTHTISKEQKLEVSFVGHVLERLQNKPPVAGKIIGMNGSSHTVKLENGSKDLFPILEPLKEWTKADSTEPPPIVLNKHCPLCPFQQSCQTQAERETISACSMALLHESCVSMRGRAFSQSGNSRICSSHANGRNGAEIHRP